MTDAVLEGFRLEVAIPGPIGLEAASTKETLVRPCRGRFPPQQRNDAPRFE